MARAAAPLRLINRVFLVSGSVSETFCTLVRGFSVGAAPVEFAFSFVLYHYLDFRFEI